SQPAPSAARTRSSTSSGSNGRAASWTTTAAASPSASATPIPTDSARLGPPVTVAVTFLQPSSSATRMDGSSQPSGATMTIASIQSEASSRSRLSASSGRLRRGANALGRSPPSRSPRPAATRTAQVLKGLPLDGGADLRLDGALLSVRAHAREDVVEPGCGLILVHLLRVHELAGEDLLRLHEHLLLPGRETLLVVAQREVHDHLGELEDVAGLHLVAIVLEPSVPVLGHLRARAGKDLHDLR